jgi:prophage DNA circulation protein
MARQDKTLEAKYTSPSGKEFYFTWDKSLSRETELKTGIFTFPDRDGAHVQHQGAGARSFPLEVIFTGPDCMDKADEFEAALIERDIAELQHPIYGIVKVIPTGNIKRENDLISALNESHVTITFTETIADESPTELEVVSADELEEKYDDFSESAAVDFAENISIESVAEELQLQSVMEIQAQSLDDNLSGLMAANAGTFANFKTSTGELKASIKELKIDRFFNIKDLYNNTKKIFKNAEKIVQKAINTARLALNIR